MKDLKLNKIAKNRLTEKEMENTKGGAVVKKLCGCACAYANSGGSSTDANRSANAAKGLTSDGTPDGIYFYDTASGKVFNLLGQGLN